jgi:hypothetical protein
MPRNLTIFTVDFFLLSNINPMIKETMNAAIAINCRFFLRSCRAVSLTFQFPADGVLR